MKTMFGRNCSPLPMLAYAAINNTRALISKQSPLILIMIAIQSPAARRFVNCLRNIAPLMYWIAGAPFGGQDSLTVVDESYPVLTIPGGV
jgi:hypothetical protein